MKRSSAIFLQVVIAIIAIAVFVAMLAEPHFEGRNAHVTGVEVYFGDLFLVYAYVASIPFFVALYQVFKVLGCAGQGAAVSPAGLKRLRAIKQCAWAMIGLTAVGESFIMMGDSDDRAGGVFVGGLIALGAIVMAILAAKFERRVEQRVR